ncbi:hypothetical protein LWI28_027000 [Acer negundo]|uniref:Uncharacterized protein n=1 Tax=Acer negundo TaxID=4023 RepID=A0AAD5ISC2_ACENE|nr:hypothetical protein LWI28_027000 [Acer negundo]
MRFGVSGTTTQLCCVFLDRASATSVGIRAVFVRDDIIMPPRRRPDQIPVDLAIERDRVIQLERQVEQLTAQLATSRANQNPFQALHPETSSDEVEGEPQPRRRQRAPVTDDRVDDRTEDVRRWESGMRTEVPEFHGSMQPEEFLEWIGIADEILEFKRVPAN